MLRFPQIQTGPGIWREVTRGLPIIMLPSIKCHFFQRIFPTAIEFQVRIKLIHVGELTWFWILCCFELTSQTTIFPLHFQYFQLNDASFLMLCKNVHFAFYTSKRESFKVAKHFRTAHVPAAERFHTWKFRGRYKHSFHTFSILKTHNSSRKVMFRWRKFFCGMELPPGAL